MQEQSLSQDILTGTANLVEQSNRTGVSVEFYRGSETTTPDYYRSFVTEHAESLSNALGINDETSLTSNLRTLAEILPRDNSFREIASFIGRRPNGNLFVTTVEGDLETIDSKRAGMLLDDLVEALPIDVEQLLFFHDHLAEQSPIGAIPTADVRFSEPDKNFMKVMGEKLRAFDVKNVYAGLSTAYSNKVILEKGVVNSNAKVYGWSINAENKPV